MADLVEGQRLREGYAPDEFTIRAVAGVIKTRPDIDVLLESHAKDWPLDRIAPLERSILRLAVWEIQSDVTPPEVAIDEAVRLTKRYSTDEAGAFVNGVLGGIVSEVLDQAGSDEAGRDEAGSDEAGSGPVDWENGDG